MARFFWPFLSFSCAQYAPPPNPVANPASVVIIGDTRITLLSPSFIRFEVRSANATSFDDRATLQAVNRDLPVPPFTVAPINASAATITTSLLTITVVGSGSPPVGVCASPQAGMDVSNPRRSPTYPNGLNGTTQASCCTACSSDNYCRGWVYASDRAGGVNCWPLLGFDGFVPSAGRVSGGVAGRGAGVTVDFKGPDGATVTWTPGARDPANLNGT